MFCRSCGSQFADDAVVCPRCGIPVAGRAAQAGNTVKIPNHLVGSILATIFCCLPFGIPAIVYALQVNSRVAAGDYEGAMQASKKANMWMLISVAIGVALALIGGLNGMLRSSAY